MVRTDAWKHQPDPVRDARGALGADGAVEEVVTLVGRDPCGLRLLAVDLVPDREADHEHDENSDGEQCLHARVPSRLRDQKVLRYSSKARFSSAGRAVPNAGPSWPALSLPGWWMSKRKRARSPCVGSSETKPTLTGS